MPTRHMNGLVNRLRRAALLPDGSGLGDGQLLARFVTQRDGDAFTALVNRHGPMVMGVCRRVLLNPHDAEDAFQATFLVLARKAASVTAPAALGGWLYRVAYRTALEARARIARRRATEQQVKDMPHPEVGPDEGWRELLPLLDRELDRLPDKYRVPVVLCELEGRSRKEVARLLGLPEATLSWRLAHAKKLLAKRLARYGAGALAAALVGESVPARVPAALVASTARGAMAVTAGRVLSAGVVSVRVMTLTEGVLKAMFLSKLKLVSGLILAVAVGVGAVGLTYRPAAAQQAAPSGPTRSARVAADELEELRLEVAALRKGLEVTRQRVKALEGEVRTLQGRAAASGAAGSPRKVDTEARVPAAAAQFEELFKVRPDLAAEYAKRFAAQPYLANDYAKFFAAQPHLADAYAKRFATPPYLADAYAKRLAVQPADDPVGLLEGVLKHLRANPHEKQAVDALERALKQLKERPKPQATPNKLRGGF